MADFKGGTAVVTGGGAGIGEAMCHAWSDRGLNIVIADIDGDRARQVATAVMAKGGAALAVETDVTSAASVEVLANATYARFGAVTILCNNAGVMLYGPVVEAHPTELDWVFGVNLWGVTNVLRAFLPRMRAQGVGRRHVVNTASLAGLRVTMGETGLYAASKYAVTGLTEGLREDLASETIGVSLFCPGLVASSIHGAARCTATATPRLPVDRSHAMSPSDAAEHLCRGVEAGDFYIFTHSDPQGILACRHRAIEAAIPA